MAAERQALEGLDPQPLKCRGRDPPKVIILMLYTVYDQIL